MSKKNYTENHIWCHREVARVLQTYQSAWKSYAKKLVPQISGQLGHFSNDEICNFDSKVTIKIAQTNSIQIVDLSKMLIFPKKSNCPINSHMFGSSNHDQSWLVVEKNNHHDTDKTHFLPIQEPAAMGSTDVHIWVSVVHLHVTWFKNPWNSKLCNRWVETCFLRKG